jgi:hypothetical protein
MPNSDTYGLIMQGLGLSLQSAQFQVAARHLTRLMVTQGITIVQALETVENGVLREKLRVFMYAVQLSVAVVTLRETGSITREQGNELLAFLQSMTFPESPNALAEGVRKIAAPKDQYR